MPRCAPGSGQVSHMSRLANKTMKLTPLTRRSFIARTFSLTRQFDSPRLAGLPNGQKWQLA